MLHITRLPRLARLSSVSALCSLLALSFAQAPAPRIRGPIELTPSVPLEGSLNPHVRLADDLGPLAPDTPIRGVTLVFKRTPPAGDRPPAASRPANQSLLAALSSLAHARRIRHPLRRRRRRHRRHRVLAPVPRLHHRQRPPDRVTFSGTAAEIQQAFGAELHRFRSGSDAEPELHFAPATELSLPPALAPLTAAVLHLSDFRPKPSVRALRPDYTTLSNQSHFLSPKDISGMYDAYDFLAQGYPGNINQGLAVVGQSFVKTGTGSAIANFQTASSAPAPAPSLLSSFQAPETKPSSPATSANPRSTSSTPPNIVHNASVFFVYTGSSPNYDVLDALAFAITNDVAQVITISYGICEPLVSTSNLQQYNAIFEQAAAQGQTIVASSGDSGAAGCARYSSSQGVSTTQQQALAVDFPASSPYVTAVGGTQMAPGTFAPGSSNYWAAASGPIDNTISLLSYVPEVAWNEDSTTQGILASGGGPSSFFPRPAWQATLTSIPWNLSPRP